MDLKDGEQRKEGKLTFFEDKSQSCLVATGRQLTEGLAAGFEFGAPFLRAATLQKCGVKLFAVFPLPDVVRVGVKI